MSVTNSTFRGNSGSDSVIVALNTSTVRYAGCVIFENNVATGMNPATNQSIADTATLVDNSNCDTDDAPAYLVSDGTAPSCERPVSPTSDFVIFRDCGQGDLGKGTLDLYSVDGNSVGTLALRVTRAEVEAAAPGCVAASADGRFAVVL